MNHYYDIVNLLLLYSPPSLLFELLLGLLICFAPGENEDSLVIALLEDELLLLAVDWAVVVGFG
jgi:hypothetical protein